MLPDFTASMISSSLVRSVPPWNTALRLPPERLVSSSHIHLKTTPLDSGGGVTCARSSFFTPGLAWPTAGLRPPASATASSTTVATAQKSRPRMSRPPDSELRLSRLTSRRGNFTIRRAYARAIVVGRRHTARRDHAADDRRHRRHARGRVPPLRDDEGLGDLRPADRQLLLGRGSRRVVAGLDELHRRGALRAAGHPLRGPPGHRSLPGPPAAYGARGAVPLDRPLRRVDRRLRLAGGGAQQPVVLAGARPEPPLALSFIGRGRCAHGRLRLRDAR